MSSDVFIGLACYAVTLACLFFWDRFMVPRFDVKASLPGLMTKRQREQKWADPWTASSPVPPPTLERLETIQRYQVAKVDGVRQFITAAALGKETKGQREISSGWSAYYNTTIVIFKELA